MIRGNMVGNMKLLTTFSIIYLLSVSQISGTQYQEKTVNSLEYWTSDWKCSDVLWVFGGAAAAVVAVPPALAAAGFGAAGIAAGSIAAKTMSVAASTGLGMSAVATLQSIGAAGLGWAGVTVVGTVGYVAGKAVKGVVMDCKGAESEGCKKDTTG